MSTICDNNQCHQYHHHKNPFNDHLEIPPRKLLMLAQKDTLDHHDLHNFKYLPYNDTNDEEDDSDADPYSSDHFRMYEFKVRRCTRSRSHDWTDCPFAHPGEKARRRDPRKYHYSGCVCPEFRRGGCSRGDNCEFAHGVFECWLHPSRYRTEACKDGKNCKRKVCFFAHTPKQLRILPEVSCNTRNLEMKSLVSPTCSCCLAHHSLTSPTSTLLSPSLSPSPPLSPMKQRKMKLFDSDRLRKLMTYKDAVDELMSSLEAMNFSDHMDTAATKANNLNIPWIDTSCFYYDQQEQFEQFVMSPSTPSPFKATDFYNGDCSSINDNRNVGGLASSQDPDLGWVNELLM